MALTKDVSIETMELMVKLIEGDNSEGNWLKTLAISWQMGRKCVANIKDLKWFIKQKF